MSRPPAFVVPEGVIFSVTDTGVTIENRGDVVLHASFGRPLCITSLEGSVTLHAGLDGGEVTAAGDIVVHGAASASSLRAGGSVELLGNADVAVVLAGGSVHAEGDLRGTRAHSGGDLVVSGALHVESVEAAGGVQAGGGLTSGTVRANAGVDVVGAVQVGTVRAARVSVRGAPVTARGLQASERVSLGAGRVAIDAIVAPEVSVEPATTGRVTIVESSNELGPHTLKGCLRLIDYAETFGGDGAAFLADRGLLAPGQTLPRVAAPAEAPAPAPGASLSAATVQAKVAPLVAQPPAPVVASPTPPSVLEAVHAEETWHGVRIDELMAAAEAAVPSNAAPVAAEEPAPAAFDAPVAEAAPALPEPALEVPPVLAPEPVAVAEAPAPAPDAAPVPVEVVDEEDAAARMHPLAQEASDEWGPPPAPMLPPAPPAVDPEEHPLHTQLVDAAVRIADAYADAEVPPSVQTLRTLIDERSYDRVRAEITTIWPDLLKFHQRTGMRVQHQVTTAFNTINSLVKKM